MLPKFKNILSGIGIIFSGAVWIFLPIRTNDPKLSLFIRGIGIVFVIVGSVILLYARYKMKGNVFAKSQEGSIPRSGFPRVGKINSIKSILTTLLKYVMLPTMILGLLVAEWLGRIYAFMLIIVGFFLSIGYIVRCIVKFAKLYPSLSSGLPLIFVSSIIAFIGIIIFTGFSTGLLCAFENPSSKKYAIAAFINEPLTVSCGRIGYGLMYGSITLILLLCLYLVVSFFIYLFSFAGVPRILLR